MEVSARISTTDEEMITRSTGEMAEIISEQLAVEIARQIMPLVRKELVTRRNGPSMDDPFMRRTEYQVRFDIIPLMSNERQREERMNRMNQMKEMMRGPGSIGWGDNIFGGINPSNGMASGEEYLRAKKNRNPYKDNGYNPFTSSGDEKTPF